MGHPPPGPPPTPWPQQPAAWGQSPAPTHRRLGSMLWLIAGLELVVIVGLVAFLALGGREPSPPAPTPVAPVPSAVSTAPEPSPPPPSPSPSPTESPAEKPTPPPGSEAEYFKFGRFSIAVPAGWTATVENDDALDATVAWVKNPSSPSMAFQFVDHPTNLDADTTAGDLCVTYSGILERELKKWGDTNEQPPLPVSVTGPVDVMTCSLRGQSDEGINYVFTYDSFVDVATQAGVIVRRGTITEDWETDQGEFNLWRDYYRCELAHQTGAQLNVC